MPEVNEQQLHISKESHFAVFKSSQPYEAVSKVCAMEFDCCCSIRWVEQLAISIEVSLSSGSGVISLAASSSSGMIYWPWSLARRRKERQYLSARQGHNSSYNSQPVF